MRVYQRKNSRLVSPIGLELLWMNTFWRRIKLRQFYISWLGALSIWLPHALTIMIVAWWVLLNFVLSNLVLQASQMTVIWFWEILIILIVVGLRFSRWLNWVKSDPECLLATSASLGLVMGRCHRNVCLSNHVQTLWVLEIESIFSWGKICVDFTVSSRIIRDAMTLKLLLCCFFE